MTRGWDVHDDPPRTIGRHPFVVVGKYRGGTLLHLTDDSMVEWTLDWGISTNHVTALCGLDTRKAVPELEANMEADGLRKCPRCWKAA
jgi:hypothetical protein